MMFKQMILVTGTGLLLSAAAQADLAPDARAHRACMERFKFTGSDQNLHLNPATAIFSTRESGAYRSRVTSGWPARRVNLVA